MAKEKIKKEVESPKKKSSNTASKKTNNAKVSNNTTISKKTNSTKTKSNISNKKEVIIEEKNYNKSIVIIVAIVILGVILLSIFGCENKNDVEKLQGNVNKDETKEETQKDVSNENKAEEKNKLVVGNNKGIINENKEKFLVDDTEIIVPVISTESEEKTELEMSRDAVEKAEETLSKDDILTADNLVSNLDDSEEKEELEERLDEVKETYNVKELVEKLEKLAKEAQSKREVSVAKDFRDNNEIISRVNDLKDEKIKKELEDKLKELEPILDDTTAPVITGVEDGKYYNEKVKPGVIEENIRSIKVNDVNYVIGQDLDEGTHTIVVVDMAYNEASCTFTIDVTKPELSLVGEENIVLEYNTDLYEEKGALYSDNIDGNKTILVPTTITKDDIEVASVDNKIVGKYILTYEASDTAGNVNSVVRTVEVKDTVLPEAIATAYVINGKYIVKLTNISEELYNDGTWTDNSKVFDVLPISVVIVDINNNSSEIVVSKDENEPVITEKVLNSDLYSKDYEFEITDESDIEIVKVASGKYDKDYFETEGIELVSPYNYSIYQNGDYTIYAKDALGNETVKEILVSDIVVATITDAELKSALIEGSRVCSGFDCEKTMTINTNNTFEIIEIKYISTTAKDTLWPNEEVTVDSFKNNKINGSDVVVLSLPITEFKIEHKNAGIDSRYYYIYYKVEKGTGLNKVTREHVIEVEPADGIL